MHSGPNAPVVIKDPASIHPGGYLVVISVEAIRERTERNWWTKQDAVWEFTQRRFEKTFPRTDAIHKLSDVDYLIAMVSDEGAAAQFKAIDLLKATLVFFLGASTLSQIKLSIVRSIKDGVVEADTLTQQQIQSIMDESHRAAGSIRPAFADRTHPPSKLTFTLKESRTYDIVVSVEPIWNVYKQAVASYHTRVLIYEAAGSAPPAEDLDEISLRDAWPIDVAVMRAAAAMIREGQSEKAIFALHVPISFRCLRSPSCRVELAQLLPVFEDIRKFVAFCVVGIPDGAPVSVLTEVISVLRPHGLGVVMQPSAMNKEVQRWRRLGLSALAYDFIDKVQEGADIIKRTQDFGLACAGVAPALIGLGVETRPLLMAAWGAGFTHISGAPIAEKMPKERMAIRFPAEHIYS
jgi:hypothetical protein